MYSYLALSRYIVHTTLPLKLSICIFNSTGASVNNGSGYHNFKNSLIIHEKNTKEITAVSVVLYVIKNQVHLYIL
jgi:hypothetical protein